LERNGAGEVEPGARDLSTPWNVEYVCGVREESFVALMKIGVPDAGFPEALKPCPEEPVSETELQEIIEFGNERTRKQGCYATDPAPPGCLRFTYVEPATGLEVAFGGTLWGQWVSGVRNGLTPSRYRYGFGPEGSGGELQCEAPAGCTATATAKGGLKAIGYKEVQLVVIK